MNATERLHAYSAMIARAAADLAGEESKFPPAVCRNTDCTEPAKAGCGCYCESCWAFRRARAELY